MIRRRATALLALVLVAASCASQGESSLSTSVASNTDPGAVLTPVALPTPAAPASIADIDGAVAADQALAFELYQRFVAEADGANLVFSPLSISQALHMTLVGAQGDTATQLRAALHVDVSDDVAHASRQPLLDRLAAEPEPTNDGDEREPYALNVNDALFLQQGYPFLDDYLEQLVQSYEAGLFEADFELQPAESTDAINQWVSDATEGRVNDLLSGLGSDTRAVLVDTVLFRGFWSMPLEEGGPGEFIRRDGSEVPIEWLDLEDGKPLHAAGDGWVRVTLPYVGGSSMHLVLPDEDRFDEVEASLTPEMFSVDEGVYGLVDFRMPAFDFAARPGLADALEALGVVDAFDPAEADFSGMTGTRDLFVHDAIHEANISVDEHGTEAAAATAVVFYEVSGSVEPPPVIHLDRPFLFAITHDATGEIMFLGRVMDPAAS